MSGKIGHERRQNGIESSFLHLCRWIDRHLPLFLGRHTFQQVLESRLDQRLDPRGLPEPVTVSASEIRSDLGLWRQGRQHSQRLSVGKT